MTINHKIIDLDNDYPQFYDIGLKLGQLNWEKYNQEQLLLFLIKQNKTDTKGYLKLWQKYLATIYNWNNAMQEFEEKIVQRFISSDSYNWDFRFDEGELIIDEEIL